MTGKEQGKEYTLEGGKSTPGREYVVDQRNRVVDLAAARDLANKLRPALLRQIDEANTPEDKTLEIFSDIGSISPATQELRMVESIIGPRRTPRAVHTVELYAFLIANLFYKKLQEDKGIIVMRPVLIEDALVNDTTGAAKNYEIPIENVFENIHRCTDALQISDGTLQAAIKQVRTEMSLGDRFSQDEYPFLYDPPTPAPSA